MSEAKSAWCVSLSCDVVEQLVHGFEGRRPIQRGGSSREIEIERIPGDCGTSYKALCVVRKEGELFLQGGRDARRHLQISERSACLLHSEYGLAGKRSTQLLEIERVAAAVVVQRGSCPFVDGVSEQLVGFGTCQRGDLDAGERGRSRQRRGARRASRHRSRSQPSRSSTAAGRDPTGAHGRRDVVRRVPRHPARAGSASSSLSPRSPRRQLRICDRVDDTDRHRHFPRSSSAPTTRLQASARGSRCGAHETCRRFSRKVSSKSSRTGRLSGFLSRQHRRNARMGDRGRWARVRSSP